MADTPSHLIMDVILHGIRVASWDLKTQFDLRRSAAELPDISGGSAVMVMVFWDRSFAATRHPA
jgi:hypothetical protein